MVGVAACHVAVTRVPNVGAEGNVLASDVMLVAARSVVVTSHTGVGGGALSPVEEPVLDKKVLSRVVAGWQPRDEGAQCSLREIGRHDPRAVVLLSRCPADALVRVAGEERSVVPVRERQSDGGSVRLKAGVLGRVRPPRLDEPTPPAIP